MKLIAALRRSAFARPHLLMLQGAHRTAARIAVERWARVHGWPLAASPVDADIVAVCGTVDGELGQASDRIAGRVPLPRAVVRVDRDANGADLDTLFAAGRRALLDGAAQKRLAAGLPEQREEPITPTTRWIQTLGDGRP